MKEKYPLSPILELNGLNYENLSPPHSCICRPTGEEDC